MESDWKDLEAIVFFGEVPCSECSSEETQLGTDCR